jgi:hypothetical protein
MMSSVGGREDLPHLSAESFLARGVLVILILILVYMLLGVGIFYYWQVDSRFYRELFATTVISVKTILPEPREQRVFLSIVLTAPFLTLGIWRGLSAGKIAPLVNRYAPGILALGTLLVMVLSIVTLSAETPFTEPLDAAGGAAFAQASSVNAGFYFYNTFIYNHPWVYAGFLFPGCYWLLVSRRVQCFLAEKVRWVNALILLFAITMGSWVLGTETFRFPYTVENRYDFNAVYSPMVQVYHGGQLLVDHVLSTYGLYPHLLLPLFKMTGLSVATFSGTMALGTVGCFGLLLFALWRLIDNRLLLLWTFAALVFYVLCYPMTVSSFDPYFANIPIRLVPTMIALGLVLWCRRESGRLLTVAALALLAVGVLWCPDFGLISYFAFTLFLGYLRVDLRQWRRTVFALGEVFALSLLTLSVVLCGYTLLMFLLYGMAPDLLLLFGSMRVFSGLGMNMLPMTLLHPWNLVALTFAGGLLATLPQLLDGTQNERSARLFFITILGVGVFSYYQGRSHNWNLLLVLLYVIPLWGVCADRLLFHAAVERRLLFPLAILVFVLGSSLPQLVYAWPPLVKLVNEEENKADNLPIQQRIERGAEFIRNATLPGEKMLVYTEAPWQGLYHGLAQRGFAFTPDYMNLVWRDDYRRLLTFLYSNQTVKVFYDLGSKNPLLRNISSPPTTLLECCYAPINSSGPMVQLGKVDDAGCDRCLEGKNFDFSLLQLEGR